jgi:TonB family protein
MKTNKDKSRGIIGTILFHLLLIICFIFFGFSAPFPPPPDAGMEIDLGYGDYGGTGDIKPTNPAQETAQPATSQYTEERVATQKTEPSVNLNQADAGKSTVQPEDPINANALYTGKKHTDGGSYGSSGGPGDGPGRDPGQGGGPGGISYDLKGRSFRSLEKPVYNSKEVGTVVVTIWVDKNGNVTKATAGARGTTATDKSLWRAAEQAALKSKCHIKADAPEQQTGTITYIFITN